MNSKNIGYMICEAPTTSTDMKIISSNSNRVVAEGTLQDAEDTNRNSRAYAAKDLFPELTCARTTELLTTGNLKGENGHPMSKDIGRQQTIDPDMVCVKFLKLWTEGNLVKARFKGTSGQRGDDFNYDLLDGEKPSFSLRALGTIENASGKAWVKNIKIITWDRVIYPSHKRAYTETIVAESAMIGSGHAGNMAVIENANGILIPITNAGVMNYIKHESCNIQTIMSNFDTLYESMNLVNNGRDVQLMTKTGDLFIVNLESYIHNELMDYCNKR